MRVLVVGTVPPPGGDRSRALAGVAAARLEAGDEVEVFSPDVRSAAHRHVKLRGLTLPVQLAVRARRFDALVLSIEPDLPFVPETNRLSRALTLLTLGCAVRLFSEVSLRLDSPVPIPGGLGGRASALLWQKPRTIVCRDVADAEMLLKAPGVDASRVVIEAPTASRSGGREPALGYTAAPTGREAALDLVRRRAEERRQANSSRLALGADGPGPRADSVFGASGSVGVNWRALGSLIVARLRRMAASRAV